MTTYGDYLAQIFPEFKVQKISIDAGFTCPNRDGSISTGGCSYCRNDSFSPSYCMPDKSISQQLEEGIQFFGRKYPAMKYLAYFQRYTGTYSHSLKQLEAFYREALDTENIVGLVIATRPDCLSDSTINLLSDINKEAPVFIEIGAESSHNNTLRAINRNHTWQDVEDAVLRLYNKGLHTGLHMICGLPGENENMILESVEKVSLLPIESIKFHQLQILYGTPLYLQWKNKEVNILEFTPATYLNLCVKILKILPEHIAVERFLSQSPPDLVAFPKWGLKNYQFMSKLATSIKQ